MFIQDSDDDKFDCLRNAERTMAVLCDLDIINPKGINSCTVEKEGTIGKTYADNKKSVENVSSDNSNDYAKPLKKQAFFICRTDSIQSGYQYHAAAVIYRDDKQLITIETNGGTVECFFGKYAFKNQGNEKTFHKNFTDMYKRNKGYRFKTVAIKLKNKSVKKG